MAVGVEDRLSRVADGQALAATLTISVVFGTTVGREVRSFVDDRPRLGIGTGKGSAPKGTAKVDGPEFIGI